MIRRHQHRGVLAAGVSSSARRCWPWPAAGMSVATQKLGLYLKKEPLPLKKPLDAMDAAKLAPYRVVTKHKIENAGHPASRSGPRTTSNGFWRTRASRSAVPYGSCSCSSRTIGSPDRVPHVPEECYTGGGYQRLNTDAVASRSAADGERAIPGRYLRFEQDGPAISRWPCSSFPSCICFASTGNTPGSRDDARMALNKNIFRKHSYFCKIELVFNQSSRCSPAGEGDGGSGRDFLACFCLSWSRSTGPTWE